jgi:PHS family inorganic phosphate transporter-like MFS transporter
VLAIIFRFFLYDCGLYTLEVKGKPGNAFRDTQRVYGQPNGPTNGVELGNANSRLIFPPSDMPKQFSKEDLTNYFIRDKNWYYLLGKLSAFICK